MLIGLTTQFASAQSTNETYTNLLDNPGFETYRSNALFGDTFDDWEFNMGSIFVEKDRVFEGETAVRIYDTQVNNLKPYLAQLVSGVINPFTEGEKYHYQIRYCILKSTGMQDITLASSWKQSDDDLAHDSSKLNGKSFTGEIGVWETISIETTVPPLDKTLLGQVVSFYFRINVAENCEVLFDDFQFIKTGEAEVVPPTGGLVITPSKFDAFSTKINVPVSQELTLQSAAIEKLTFEIVGKDNAQFSVSTSELTPTGSDKVTVTYNPTAASANHTATLFIDCPGHTEYSTSISLRGSCYDPQNPPTITASPLNLSDFKADAGMVHTQNVSVSSQNILDYYITAQIVSASEPGIFTLNSSAVLKNAETTMEVSFRPKKSGVYTATVALSSIYAETVYVSLSGTCTKNGDELPTEGDELVLVTDNPRVLLHETFDNVEKNKPFAIDGWKNVAVKNKRAWWGYQFDDGEKAAKVTAYNSIITDEVPYEMWLITPALDFKNAASKIFTFRVMGTLLLETSDSELGLYYIVPDGNDGIYREKITVDIPHIADYNEEWFEFHIDLTGQELEDVFFMGFCFSSTGGTASSTSYYIDDVSFGRTDLPAITSPEQIIDINCKVNELGTSKEILVSGSNLTEEITVSVGGSNKSKFEASVATLPQTGGSFTVTFSPEEIGLHEAYVKLSSRGAADRYIILYGHSSATGGIDETEAPAAKIIGGNEAIVISAAQTGTATVYTTDGRLTAQKQIEAESVESITLPRGIYVVHFTSAVQNTTQKVTVK